MPVLDTVTLALAGPILNGFLYVFVADSGFSMGRLSSDLQKPVMGKTDGRGVER